jgi:hypothetical protein
MDTLLGFYTPADRAREQAHRQADADESRANAAALRRQNEQATAELNARLPFPWGVGKVRPKFQGPSVWERGPLALHIQMLATDRVQLLIDGRGYDREPGDWLCMASLDTDTGEVRYEPEDSPHEILHSDGTGGAQGYYWPAPTCKKCLAMAEKFPRRDGKS